MPSSVFADERIILGTTTSVKDSGLIEVIEQTFEKKHNYKLDVISFGTGQILNMATRKDLDIIIVHHENSEKNFMDKGYGISRHKLMYNYFVLVGPKDDPAKISDLHNIEDAMIKIYNSKSHFVSRSDKSGTNFKEIELWKSAGLDYKEFDDWYKKIGQGMGATLNFANSIKGYTLTDISTWNFFNKTNNLRIYFDEKANLINQYNAILIDTEEKISSRIFLDWLLSEEGKILINDYRVYDKKMFYFNGN